MRLALAVHRGYDNKDRAERRQYKATSYIQCLPGQIIPLPEFAVRSRNGWVCR